MNACGQHMASNIGFHGSSIKQNGLVAPASQVVIGGGVDPEGKGFIAEKVIKVPARRTLDVVRYLLNDYEQNGNEGEYFNDFYYRLGKKYFYELLKPLGDKTNLSDGDYIDWGEQAKYEQAIGVGECAGVSYDVISSILEEVNEKIDLSKEAFAANLFADSIYHSYSSMVIGAKALLLSKEVQCNTHTKILEDFDEHFVQTKEVSLPSSFKDVVLQINKNEPSEEFAHSYLEQSNLFFNDVQTIRAKQLVAEGQEKKVIGNYYKA